MIVYMLHRNDVTFVADVPGEPGTPTIEDVNEDSVQLAWTSPKSDGGDKIRGYVIEAKEKGSESWKPLNVQLPRKDTKFTGRCVFVSLFTAVLWSLDLRCPRGQILSPWP